VNYAYIKEKEAQSMQARTAAKVPATSEDYQALISNLQQSGREVTALPKTSLLNFLISLFMLDKCKSGLV
jgi:hypothetical protein